MTTQGRTIFSFVMDHDPRFAYEAWHLARSLIEHCGRDPSSIHVQCLPEVNARRRRLFGEFGCHVHEIARFGEIAQVARPDWSFKLLFTIAQIQKNA